MSSNRIWFSSGVQCFGNALDPLLLPALRAFLAGDGLTSSVCSVTGEGEDVRLIDMFAKMRGGSSERPSCNTSNSLSTMSLDRHFVGQHASKAYIHSDSPIA